MGTEVYPFRDMQVVDYGDIPCNPFNIPKVCAPAYHSSWKRGHADRIQTKSI